MSDKVISPTITQENGCEYIDAVGLGDEQPPPRLVQRSFNRRISSDSAVAIRSTFTKMTLRMTCSDSEVWDWHCSDFPIPGSLFRLCKRPGKKIHGR